MNKEKNKTYAFMFKVIDSQGWGDSLHVPPDV